MIEFDINQKTHKCLREILYPKCHFDCIVAHDDRLYVTDQFNNLVKIYDSSDLMQIGELSGFDFPHGLDINHGMMAVTNYGSNTIDIMPFRPPTSRNPYLLQLIKHLYHLNYRLKRWWSAKWPRLSEKMR